MAEFRVVIDSKEFLDISFETFIALTKGAAILNVAQREDSLRLTMSHGLTLQIVGHKLEAFVSPSEPDEFSLPVRVSLLREGEEPLAALIGMRMWHVRQIYAIACLVEDESEDSLQRVRTIQKSGNDLETALSPEDRLYIKGAGSGSFWLDLAQKAYAKAKKAPHAALNTVSLIFCEGRTLLLRQLTAATKLKELEVEIKTFELQQKREENEKKRIEAIVDMANKIQKTKDPEVRKILQERFVRSLEATLGEKEIEPFRRLLLPDK
jgi:hypothetical protein